MTARIRLVGLDGSSPLGFLATLGLLHIVPGIRLGFAEDGSFQAFVQGFEGDETALTAHILNDAESAADPGRGWRLRYMKPPTKKTGPIEVADLKPPPEAFKEFLTNAIDEWCSGNEEAALYAAAYGTDVAVDGKGNTKPTAFHFTAAKQTFLGAVEGIRSSLNHEWIATSLFEGRGERPGSNLRWALGADRNWALMANNPEGTKTTVNAPIEWLAFRGLPLLPSFPQGTRITTSAVFGRGENMAFTWPLWSVPASTETVRSLIQVDWGQRKKERTERGIFAVCTSSIHRFGQGFGNFSPSSISS